MSTGYSQQTQPTGSGAAQLAQVIRKFSNSTYDRFEIATVEAPPPLLRVKLDGSPLVLEAADIVVAAHLTEHTRKTDSGGIEGAITFKTALEVGDRVILVSANNGQKYILLDKAVTY